MVLVLAFIIWFIIIFAIHPLENWYQDLGNRDIYISIPASVLGLLRLGIPTCDAMLSDWWALGHFIG